MKKVVTTEQPETPAEQAKVLASLREWVQELDQVEARSTVLHNSIFRAVYAWSNEAVRQGTCKGTLAAWRLLAGTLKRTPACIANWYYCGRTLDSYGFKNSVDHRIVRMISSYGKDTIPPHIRHQVSAKAKAGASLGVIQKLVRAVPAMLRNETQRRMLRLERQGRLTKQHVKIELTALQTMARKVFDKDVIITITDTDYVPLVSVGEGKATVSA